MFHKFKNLAIAKVLIYNETAKFLRPRLTFMGVADDSESCAQRHTWPHILLLVSRTLHAVCYIESLFLCHEVPVK
jgi:hypothetical protein